MKHITCQQLREHLQKIQNLKKIFDHNLSVTHKLEHIEQLKSAQKELNQKITELEKILLSEQKLVKEFKKEYFEQLKLGAELGFFEEGNPIITGIDGKIYPAPTWDAIFETLTWNHLKKIKKLEIENAHLSVFPFALDIKTIKKKWGEKIGRIQDWIGNETLFSEDKPSQLLYFPNQSSGTKTPLTKMAFLDSNSPLNKFPGWLISIIGDRNLLHFPGDPSHQEFFEHFNRKNIDGLTFEEIFYWLIKKRTRTTYKLTETFFKDGGKFNEDILFFGNVTETNTTYMLRRLQKNSGLPVSHYPIAIRIF